MPGGGIRIGRLFGIDIRLHWSWFIIFVLITWMLATQYFPSVEEYEDWRTATRWVIGLVTSLLFFASVLAHELAHSLVAKRAGLQVSAITLFIFGGVSQLTEEPKSAGSEFRMAIAGPGTSLVIGGICWGIFFATRHSASPVAGMTFWLGYINVVLAAFNLIPGFPLDGGRVLRSIVWWRSADLRRSTRIASIVGRGIGYLFIFGGIALIFTATGPTACRWLLIGWILENAAVGELPPDGPPGCPAGPQGIRGDDAGLPGGPVHHGGGDTGQRLHPDLRPPLLPGGRRRAGHGAGHRSRRPGRESEGNGRSRPSGRS